MSVSPGHYFALSSQFEPEGIYLALPLEGASRLLQGFGANPDFYGRYTYNGVRLKGHNGIDLSAAPGAWVLAADRGRVIEISVEPGGYGRYIKVEHAWGESFYAGLGAPTVDAGQAVTRGQRLAGIEAPRQAPNRPQAHAAAKAFGVHLHFAVRIAPYNRFDGWGGFSDPLPYLYAPTLDLTPAAAGFARAQEDAGPSTVLALPGAEGDDLSLPPMLVERPNQRRP